jgi:hypothetical protein
MIYSTRKLLTTYTNAVIRIQRSSDNSQSDFFAASNQVSGGVNLTASASSTCVITL